MSELVLDPGYWKERLIKAQRAGKLHHAVFECDPDRWRRVAVKHREILARHVTEGTSVLDCGCGWGRLIDLMPPKWAGEYLGIDISPDFIRLAQMDHPEARFAVWDMREAGNLSPTTGKYDLAVLVSIRPMVIRELGGDVWEKMEAAIRKVSLKLLYLEYDEKQEGSLE